MWMDFLFIITVDLFLLVETMYLQYSVIDHTKKVINEENEMYLYHHDIAHSPWN